MKYLKYNHDKFMLLLFWRYFFSDAYYTPGFTTVQAHIYLIKKIRPSWILLSLACIFKLLQLFLIEQILFLILVNLENLSLHSCLAMQIFITWLLSW